MGQAKFCPSSGPLHNCSPSCVKETFILTLVKPARKNLFRPLLIGGAATGERDGAQLTTQQSELGITAHEQSEGVNGWKITEEHPGEGILTEPA